MMAAGSAACVPAERNRGRRDTLRSSSSVHRFIQTFLELLMKLMEIYSFYSSDILILCWEKTTLWDGKTQASK